VIAAVLVLCLAAPAGAEDVKVTGKNITIAAYVTSIDPFSPLNQADIPSLRSRLAMGPAGLVGFAAVSPAPLPAALAAGAGTFPYSFHRGDVVLLVIRGVPREGWHTYPIKGLPGQDENQLGKIELKSDQLAFVGPTIESKPSLVDEKGIGKQLQYHEPFTWIQAVLIKPSTPPGQVVDLSVNLPIQVCDENHCVKETDLAFSVPLLISTAAPLALSSDTEKQLREWEDTAKARTAREKTNGAKTVSPSASFDIQKLVIEEGDHVIGGAAKDEGLWATIIKAIVAGFISLVTPCVFPMIPVTVSIFLKRSEAKVGPDETPGPGPITMAVVYCGTIVAVLTAGGIALVSVLATISQHWATNLFLTFIFVFFALSLLGMYEIQLPSGLANLTGSKQGQSGLTGIVFMALTFSIISFACVGPIYGGFITLEAASGSAGGWLPRVLGPLAFSLAFASPFFFLALFPTLLKSMPKSGSWMNSVKVVMGFLELAAAFKFIRAAELNYLQKSEYFTFDLCLGAYVALAFACGLYLLNVYRLPHDHEAPETIGVPRLMFSLMFITIGLYLLPGLFKVPDLFKDGRPRAVALEKSQKPRGVVYDWARAFLLPDDASDWGSNLATAIAQAEKEGKPIFIDFTGLG
jgi:thiol:disulfide interchange protein DsbD